MKPCWSAQLCTLTLAALSSPAQALSLDAGIPPPDVGPGVHAIAVTEQLRFGEGTGGRSRAVLTVRRVLGAVEDPLTVTYRVVPRSASPRDDFELPLTGTITLLANEASKDLVIEVVGDTEPECDEYLYVRFEMANQSLIGSLVIEDDDRPRPSPATDASSGGPMPIDAPYVAPYTCKDGISIYTYPACMHEPSLTGACPGQIEDRIFDGGSGTTTDGALDHPAVPDVSPVDSAEVGPALDAGFVTGGGGGPDAAPPVASDGGASARPDTSAPPQQPRPPETAGCSCDVGRPGSPAGVWVLVAAAAFMALRKRHRRSAVRTQRPAA